MEPLLIVAIVVALVVVALVGFVVFRNKTRAARGNVAVLPREIPSDSSEISVAERETNRPTATDPVGRPVIHGDETLVPASGLELEPPKPRERPERAGAEVEPEAVEPKLLEPQRAGPEVLVRPRFRDRLGKARGALTGYFGSVLGRSSIDAATWDDLEEALIVADMGPEITTDILNDLRGRVKSEGISSPDQLLEALKSDLKKRLAPGDRTLRFDPDVVNVWLFVGVNGVGKTTTIGKLAKREVESGRNVLMAAGDTFRAAAAEQLGMWAERSGVDIVRGKEGSDPGAVIFDAVERAGAKGVKLVLADTAGRLQTKSNLMEELKKIRRIADREPGRVTETLLVLDATTGQNGLIQAEQFRDTADITGVVLTKLDGTAKGGIAFAIQTKLGIPVKLVGLGEKVEDLVPFDPDEYVDALFEA